MLSNPRAHAMPAADVFVTMYTYNNIYVGIQHVFRHMSIQ